QGYSARRPTLPRTTEWALQGGEWCARYRTDDCCDCSSGLVQTERVRVQFVDGPFVFDDAVDGDAAAQRVAVALSNHVGDDRGIGGGDRVGPRQRGVVDSLRRGMDVLVVDCRRGSWRAEDLVDDFLGVERNDVVRDTAAC